MAYLDDTGAAAARLLNGALPEETMAKMSFKQLRDIRESTQNMDVQNHVAPFENRAFAREAQTEAPLAAAISLGLGSVVRTGMKAVGMKPTYLDDPNDTVPQSSASWKAIEEAFKGIGEGIKNKFTKGR